jgi:DNA-binding transcriptional ArsR family regulator
VCGERRDGSQRPPDRAADASAAAEASTVAFRYASAMISRYRLAEIAALFGDPTRAGIVTSLSDGRSRPAGELARLAGITPATASEHLARLVSGGVLRVEPRGRHRYFRIAGPGVADALETLSQLLSPRAAKPEADDAHAPLARARMCYDHVAGRLGVAITKALLDRRLLRWQDQSFVLPVTGRRWFERTGVDVGALERGRRPLVRACLDWTERREHLGGALGAALAMHLLERDWVRRERGTRALLVTREGRSGLARTLGIRNAGGDGVAR